MVYHKLHQDLDLSESVINTESSNQSSVMRVLRSFVAACMLSMAKVGYYLSFDKSENPEQVFANKSHTKMYAVRCLGVMTALVCLSYWFVDTHPHAFDVQRIGLLFDYIVP